jgi:hypothetical protein
MTDKLIDTCLKNAFRKVSSDNLLKRIPTADLVTELCSRKGVSSLSLHTGESCGYPLASPIYGPVRIIIVQGEE